jgi:ribosomal protein L11 methyltransferase
MTTRTPESFIEVTLQVPREQCDAVCNYIVDNITTGMVLEDEEDDPMTGVIFYVPSDKSQEFRAPLEKYLAAVFPIGHIPEIREKTVKNVEWEEQYKASIVPIWITDDLRVRATWHAPEPKATYDLVIEPKMAFGTGTHETTRSCLQIIRERFKPGMRLLDLGTGSGILSILADKMGAKYIKAIDYDLVAVDNCKENFEINGVTTPREVLFGSIEKCAGDAPYDFVCANIIKSTILPMLPRLILLTSPGGLLVLSGLLDIDEDDTTAALKVAGLDNFSILLDNKWLTYTITRS